MEVCDIIAAGTKYMVLTILCISEYHVGWEQESFSMKTDISCVSMVGRCQQFPAPQSYTCQY